MKSIDVNTQNTCDTSQLEKEYFELRIEQEHSLNQFKKEQSLEKANLNKNLKKLNGVSKLRISNAITLIKKFDHKSVQERTDETYELIISSLERSFIRHYEGAETEIKSYLISIYNMQDELKLFRKEKKKIFNDFKKKIKECNIDLSMLNLAYQEFKNTISYIKKEKISLTEYNLRVSKHNYLNKLAESFIVSEYNKLHCERIQKAEENENKRLEQELYLKSLNEMFGLENKKELQVESYVMDILSSMFESGELA